MAGDTGGGKKVVSLEGCLYNPSNFYCELCLGEDAKPPDYGEDTECKRCGGPGARNYHGLWRCLLCWIDEQEWHA